ncbi:uncharacterized protein LOC143302879 [Bombus vancouverensis nearcticus]|uniref:uncharacterized protein LOC143302879 n=1 Tax=Bombus vancouverensis nearcticus TaxID=2705178 RepID=UPI00402B2B49
MLSSSAFTFYTHVRYRLSTRSNGYAPSLYRVFSKSGATTEQATIRREKQWFSIACEMNEFSKNNLESSYCDQIWRHLRRRDSWESSARGTANSSLIIDLAEAKSDAHFAPMPPLVPATQIFARWKYTVKTYQGPAAV